MSSECDQQAFSCFGSWPGVKLNESCTDFIFDGYWFLAWGYHFVHLWLSQQVYNVTEFLEDHPGGDEVLLSGTGNKSSSHTALVIYNVHWVFVHRLHTVIFMTTGKDATDDFEDVGHSESARETMSKYYVGEIDISTLPERLTYTGPKQPHYNQDKTTEFIIKLLQFLVPLAILGLAVGIRFYNKSSWGSGWDIMWCSLMINYKPLHCVCETEKFSTLMLYFFFLFLFCVFYILVLLSDW